MLKSLQIVFFLATTGPVWQGVCSPFLPPSLGILTWWWVSGGVCGCMWVCVGVCVCVCVRRKRASSIIILHYKCDKPALYTLATHNRLQGCEGCRDATPTAQFCPLRSLDWGYLRPRQESPICKLGRGVGGPHGGATTPPTNCWPEAPWGGGRGMGWTPPAFTARQTQWILWERRGHQCSQIDASSFGNNTLRRLLVLGGSGCAGAGSPVVALP